MDECKAETFQVGGTRRLYFRAFEALCTGQCKGIEYHAAGKYCEACAEPLHVLRSSGAAGRLLLQCFRFGNTISKTLRSFQALNADAPGCEVASKRSNFCSSGYARPNKAWKLLACRARASLIFAARDQGGNTPASTLSLSSPDVVGIPPVF